MSDWEDWLLSNDAMAETAESAEAAMAEAMEALADPRAVIRAQVEQAAQAAMALRFAPDRWPRAEAPPIEIKNALVHVRALLDQVDAIMATMITLRASTTAAAVAAERAADDAWDDQAEAERRSRRPRPEFQGSKERYAYWNIAIRQQRAEAREARDLADAVRAAHDVVRHAHDGLNETRRDLASRLAHFRWETHMEQ